MSRDINMPLAIDDIIIPEGRREVDPAVVKRLADSIESIGLRHPVTVRKKGEQYILVAGRHRIEACKKVGREHVPAIIVSMTNAEARMWEIAENLHRAELSRLERSNQIGEWVQLVSDNLSQTRREGRPGALAAASRGLGIGEKDVQRAVQIAGITPEAKEAAAAAGMADNQSKLLEVAKAEPSRQVATVHELAAHKPTRVDGDVKERAAQDVAEMIAEHVPGGAWATIKANLYAAGASNIANALTNITGQAIMDARFK
jgi:ParB/RepB/Spo0J family partition protein